MNSIHRTSSRALLARLVPTLLLLAPVTLLPAQTVEIPDPFLRSAIRYQLQKQDGELTVADMEGLVHLSVNPRGDEAPIETLEGLQSATNLESLTLGTVTWGTQNTRQTTSPTIDLSALAALPKLHMLALYSHQAPTIHLPEGLSALSSLFIAESQLTSLVLPTGLDQLTSLYLYQNLQLETLSIPEALPSLEALSLQASNLTDFSFLERLPALNTLDLYSHPATTIYLPDGLSALTSLGITGSQLTSLALPGGLENLATLHLGWNAKLETLTIPEALPSLETLNLQASNLTNFSFLEQLPALTTLDLTHYRQPSLTLPDGLHTLRTLGLSLGELTSLTLPRGLTGLEELDLSSSPPTGIDMGSIDWDSIDWDNLGPLKSLTLSPDMLNLTRLAVPYQRLTSLSIPDELTSLQVLVLCFNPLTELQLSPLPRLEELHLWNTPLADAPGLLAETLTPLASTPKLDVASKTMPFLISHDPSNKTITLRWVGSPGQWCVVQHSSDLIEWSDYFWIEVGEDGIGTYTVELDSNSPETGFYHLLEAPPLDYRHDCPDVIILW